MIRRLAAALALAAGILIGPAAMPAAAFDLKPGDCPAAPTPSDPNSGLIQNWRTERGIPPQADPFASDATTTIFEQYGPAQFTFHVVPSDPDSACILQAPIGTITFGIANFLQGPVEIVWEAVAEIAHYALNPAEWTPYIDPLVVHSVQVAHDAVWTPYSGLLFLAVALVLIGRAVAHGHHSVAKTAIGCAAIAGAVYAVTTHPLWLAERGDSLLQQGVLYASSAGKFYENGGHTPVNPGEHIAGVASDALNFDQWCQGQTGASAASEFGRKYCPRLFKDQARTWAEATLTGADAEALIKQKQDDWTAAWSEIKKQYPANYEYGLGNQSDSAAMGVLWMYVGAACVLPIVLGGLVVVLAAYLMFRAGSVGVPVYGTLGLLPAARRVAWLPFKWIGIALVNGVLWFSALVLHVAFISGVLSPSVTIPGGVKMLICAVVTWFMWKALKPLRTFTRSSIGRGYDPGGEASGAWSRTKRMAGTVLAGAAGAAIGAGAATAAVTDKKRAEEPESDADQLGSSLVVTDVRRRQREAYADAPGDVSYEQVPDPAPPRPPVAPVDAGAAPATALPAGSGREGATTFHDAPAAAGTPSPTDIPSPDSGVTSAVRPQTLDGEEVYVIFNPETGGFGMSGASTGGDTTAAGGSE